MSALTPDEIHAVNRTAEREEKRAQARYHGQNHPKAILLAGQPGAGKTMLSSLMLPSLDDVIQERFQRESTNIKA